MADGDLQTPIVNVTSGKGAIRNRELAERLFTTALNPAEDRRGGLLVVLDSQKWQQALSRELICLRHFPIMANTPSQAHKTSLIACCA
jgi:hypothetical protein